MKGKKVIFLIALLLVSAHMEVERVSCHYAWLEINPDFVMQGGEFEIVYNISKFFVSEGGLVVAKTKMRSINITLEVPEGMNCAIKFLEVTGNGTITRNIRGLSVEIKASEDIGNLNLVASVQVPLDFEVGVYTIRVKARAREVDEEGHEIYPVDYSTSEKIEVKPFGPIFSIRAEPKEVEPPFTVGVMVTIMHQAPVPPFNISNLTLRVIPPPPNEPKVIPLIDIFGRTVLRPGCSIRFPRPVYVEISEETAGGIREIRAELEFWVMGMKKVLVTTTNVTVIKKTQVNISANVPSEVLNGSELRLNAEVVNVGSFLAKKVIVLGELGGEKSVVEVGDLRPGEFRDVELVLPVRGAGNETLRLRVFWNNIYPPEQVSNSVEFTIFVKKGGFSARSILLLSIPLLVVLGWLIGKAVKRSATT